MGWSLVSIERKRTTGRAASKRSPSRPISRPARWWPDCSASPTSAWARPWLSGEPIWSASADLQAIADYIADDYQLGHKLHALGLRNIISEVVVSTRLASGSWLGAWRHQVRWARTIRLSGGAGYAGLPITYATLWVAIAAAVRTVVDRAARCWRSGWHGDGVRLAPARKRGRLEILLCDPAARSMRASRCGRRACLGTRWSGGIRRLRLDGEGRIVEIREASGPACYNGVRAPVAQLDRASGYEPEGRVFESLRAHHRIPPQPQAPLHPAVPDDAALRFRRQEGRSGARPPRSSSPQVEACRRSCNCWSIVSASKSMSSHLSRRISAGRKPSAFFAARGGLAIAAELRIVTPGDMSLSVI